MNEGMQTLHAPAGLLAGRAAGHRRHDPAAGLVVGLVNNMPPAASRATEAEFRKLLTAAAPPGSVRLRWFVLPQAASPAPHYEDLPALFDGPIDGLIVTGCEPLADRLDREPHWPALARLVDWAAEHTVSTIWSCLAAQAAVLRLDGITRRPFPRKLSGVFDCVKVFDHPLVADAPAHWPVPHSRLNDLDEHELVRSGYQILARAPQLGADSFLKQAGNSLFVLLQGHPEYAAGQLLREYRRDVRRFLLGQRPDHPDLPEHYFEPPVARQLAALGELARHAPSEEILAMFDAVATAEPNPSWRPQAARLYANWLAYLAERKAAARADDLAVT